MTSFRKHWLASANWSVRRTAGGRPRFFQEAFQHVRKAHQRSGAPGGARTYVHLAEEFAYLAVVLDEFSRKVIGCALAIHLLG
ncbi:hypothetical protein [Mesorhizobium loti]|uniref:hypothetical protein n=1 Tax=Rhizobium loti TaxID=381 RepID=UPI001596C1EC|nr:hypothetical protein [Mesorhizobium loti]